MSQSDLPTPDETWSESALRSHQVMTEKLKEMSKQVELLTGLVDQLQRQLKLNSKTSSKPPSSDRERRAPKPKKKSGRAKGGQKGRKGSTRMLLEPHEVIQCEPIDAQCDCGGSWVGRDTVRRLQVTELPEVQPVVTEYQERCMSCEHCGRKTYAGVQLPLGESRFGPRLHAFVVSLNLESRLSLRQIQRLLKQSFNLSISVGAISDMIKRTAQHTQGVFDELRRWFQADSSPKHVDETGWRVHGERTQLIGSLSQAVALYQCSKQRKADDVRRLIGDDLSQLIICDRAFVYHPWKRRQLCWAHTLRDFHCFETYHRMKPQAEALVRHAQSLFQLSQDHRLGRITTSDYVASAAELRPVVKALLNELSLLKVAEKPDGTIRNLLEHEAQLWTFLEHPMMSIHNNYQESALRPLVIKRKLSFGNDTAQGADRLAQLMSIIETLKRQGRDVCSWFIHSFNGETSTLIPSAVTP